MDLDGIDSILTRAEKFHLDPNGDDVRLLRRRKDFLEMKKSKNLSTINYSIRLIIILFVGDFKTFVLSQE